MDRHQPVDLMGWTRRAVLRAAAGGAGILMTSRAAFAEAARLTFETLYAGIGVTGITFSERLQGLNGKDVQITGYMAPPLKAESNFFVLTKEPLALCPFCQSDAEWPVDIVVIYLKQASPLTSAGRQVSVTGRLEMGSWADPESGFVSLLRIVDASYR